MPLSCGATDPHAWVSGSVHQPVAVTSQQAAAATDEWLEGAQQSALRSGRPGQNTVYLRDLLSDKSLICFHLSIGLRPHNEFSTI